ncbi:MAG: YhfC family intramembrane metalloprotease [Acetivibrionales bacterium]|jgi:uncharacterized membrane protein YhfC
MVYSVPTLSIVFMVVTAFIGIAIPIVLFFIFRKKYKADIKPFFMGCVVFIVFALILERIFHSIILASGAGKVIQSNIWLYGIYGGLMAGFFEETGRFIAFKNLLKNNSGNDMNSLMYGAGHGGIEALIILVFSMISNIVMSVMLNKNMAEQLISGITDEAQLQILYNAFETLAKTPSGDFLMAAIERLAAVVIHLSLSVLVWFAVKNRGKNFRLYPLAILLHTVVNAFAVILAKYVPSMWIVLAVIYILAASFAAIASKVWKMNSSDNGIELNNNMD